MERAAITLSGRPAFARTALFDRTVAPRRLLALFAGWLAIDQLLLWRFLGLIGTSSLICLSIAMVAAVGFGMRRIGVGGTPGPSIRVLLIAGFVALIVFLLGGEGRLFYATTDWQVRGAVLRDLVVYPWPFAYDTGAAPQLLRAPLGMYLVPALIGKAGGVHAAEFALLGQNTLLFALLIGLGAMLFQTARARAIALMIFLGFSGLDAIGQLLTGQPLSMNAERWSLAVFSAHLTQAFWVPPHALAGWTAALLYLLWRDRKLSLAGFLAPLPLLALWSPLALMGALPFAAHAGIETLRRRELGITAIIAPAVSSLLALPGLLYLATGSDAVGGGTARLPLHQYLAFEAIEVGPYLLALAYIGRAGRFGGVTLLTTVATLLLIPLGQVGQSNDFTMRASIPALAILALAVAEALLRAPTSGDRLQRRILMGALAIGAITPAFELYRALTLPRSPAIRCSYFGVVPGGYNTYVAPLDRASPLIAPRSPALIRPDDHRPCWDGPWPGPILSRDEAIAHGMVRQF